jgi:hypothetical protein
MNYFIVLKFMLNSFPIWIFSSCNLRYILHSIYIYIIKKLALRMIQLLLLKIKHFTVITLMLYILVINSILTIQKKYLHLMLVRLCYIILFYLLLLQSRVVVGIKLCFFLLCLMSHYLLWKEFSTYNIMV